MMGARAVRQILGFNLSLGVPGTIVYSDAVTIVPQNPCQLGIEVRKPYGFLNAFNTYTVQFTMDDVSTTAGLNQAKWFDHPFLLNLTDEAASNVDKPISALRIKGTQFANTDQFFQMIVLQMIES